MSARTVSALKRTPRQLSRFVRCQSGNRNVGTANESEPSRLDRDLRPSSRESFSSSSSFSGESHKRRDKDCRSTDQD